MESAHTGRSGIRRGGGLLLLALWLTGPWRLALALDIHDIHVDADRDLDKLGQDGTEQSPFSRITTALESVDPSRDTVIHLAPAESPYGLGNEVLPIPLPVGRRSLTIVGTGPEPVLIVGDPRAPAVFEIIADESVGGSGGSVEIRNLRIERADTGVAAVGPRAGELTVTLRDCVFEFQSDHHSQFVAGEEGKLRVAVERCGFLGSSLFGLDLGGQPRSELEFSIAECRFSGDGPGADSPSSGSVARSPRAAVSIFLDAGAGITGLAERNRFRDPGVGILVSGAESGGQPGRLDLSLVSNSLLADPESAPGAFTHGLQIATVSHHRLAVRLAHNTLVGGSGFGIFFDDLPEDRGPQFVCGQRSLELLGNIVHGFRLGEISAEYEDGVVPDCVSLRRNALNGSAAIGEAGNIAVSDGDLEWRDGLFEPAPDSPLVDAIQAELPEGSQDARGGCRQADGDGDGRALVDLGAVESPGLCKHAFLRGDCQHSGLVDVTDAIHVLLHLFVGGLEVDCEDACDVDDSGTLDVSDAIYTLSFLFLGGDAPLAPHPEIGPDPTPDDLELCRPE